MSPSFSFTLQQLFGTAGLQQGTGKRPRSFLAAGLFAGTLLQPLLSADLEEDYLLEAEFFLVTRKYIMNS
ncbi:MAG: hypothetical protein JRC87_04035 [Deltaproteobacteria bacterium]|nr:hypothetical protein [Deltaproteobacteria bacterium]MBW2658757.1 hypothetical protein [Deltaproteobacteria bacterium]